MPAVVSLKDVTLKQDRKTVLKDVHLNVEEGDFVYLIGKTGSGKSSLLKALYADLTISKGAGSITGFDLEKLKNRQIPHLRRQIGVVFQDFKLLPDRNVLKNLYFVLKATGWKGEKIIRERITHVLDLVGMVDSAHKLPNTLSGGEQQRIAIARALLNNPKIIIADEPTGNLDPITSLEVMELLQKINAKGTTILMATHDFNMIVKYPSKTYKCEKGVLTEVIPKRTR